MKRKLKPFIAVALGLMVSLFGISTASAGTLNGDGVLVNEDGNDTIQAAITKVLQMPIGTAIPNAQFVYNVDAKSLDGDEGLASTMPQLGTAGTVTINFAPGAAAVDPPLASGDDAYYVQSSDIFANVDAAFFPHAGIYVYEVTEQSDTNPTIDSDKNQELRYSQGKYTLTIYVANTPDGVTPAGTYISALATTYTTNDDGTAATGDKVDPTPDANGTYSEMAFTNEYVHTNGPVDPEDPDTPPVDPTDPDNATLAVSKTVTGTLGNKAAYFEMSVTITPPALQENVPTAYRAYVVDSTGVVTSDSNGTIAGTDTMGKYLEITPGSAATISLKDGQKLVVVNAAVGSTYTVSEAATDHEPSVSVTTKGVDTTPATSSANAHNPLDTGSQHVGEPTNTVTFTNNRDMLTPTGLSMNQLPFVGLILLAVGALVAYTVVKTRKTTARAKMAAV